MPHKAVTSVSVFALKLFCYPAHRRFQKSLQNPKAAQDKLLRQMMHDLSRTAYGRMHGISGGEDYAAFSAQLPLQDYDSFAPWINRQLKGEVAITPHAVVHVEPTSGSSGAVKHIPHTRPLLLAFSTMFRIWAYDILSQVIKPKTGRIFISLSPSSGDGFNDDSDYLGFPLRQMLAPFLVMPAAKDMRTIAQTLLRERDLEIISIWSPSYLLELMAQLPDIDWRKTWPQLKLISCWDSAHAAAQADKLRAIFPDVVVQGKGLLATEGPVTVPLSQGHAPLLNSVFFEFEMPDGEIKRLHDLKQGDRANIIMTQRGGLTRYRLGDTVLVGASIGATHTLTFLGRAAICDLVGEKLNEVFVREALQPLLPDGNFVLLPQDRGYVLLAEKADAVIAVEGDKVLCRAYHYNLARHLGQLLPLHVVEIKDLAHKLRQFHQARGMKAGDIKDTALITDVILAQQIFAMLGTPQPLGSPSMA